MTKKAQRAFKRMHQRTALSLRAATVDEALQALLETPSQPERSIKIAKDLREMAEATRQRTRESKARFDAAHKKGMDALHRRDHEALGQALAEERAAAKSLLVTNRRQRRKSG
jgi:hypothetical protein